MPHVMGSDGVAAEIGLFWDGRKHRGTVLAHSHTIVNGRSALIGRSGASTARRGQAADVSTVAILANARLRLVDLGQRCRRSHSHRDRLGSNEMTLTVLTRPFRDPMTVFAA